MSQTVPIYWEYFSAGKIVKTFSAQTFQKKKKMYVNVSAWQNTSAPKMFLIITYAAYETFDK